MVHSKCPSARGPPLERDSLALVADSESDAQPALLPVPRVVPAMDTSPLSAGSPAAQRPVLLAEVVAQTGLRLHVHLSLGLSRSAAAPSTAGAPSPSVVERDTDAPDGDTATIDFDDAACLLQALSPRLLGPAAAGVRRRRARSALAPTSPSPAHLPPLYRALAMGAGVATDAPGASPARRPSYEGGEHEPGLHGAADGGEGVGRGPVTRSSSGECSGAVGGGGPAGGSGGGGGGASGPGRRRMPIAKRSKSDVAGMAARALSTLSALVTSGLVAASDFDNAALAVTAARSLAAWATPPAAAAVYAAAAGLGAPAAALPGCPDGDDADSVVLLDASADLLEPGAVAPPTSPCASPAR